MGTQPSVKPVKIGLPFVTARQDAQHRRAPGERPFYDPERDGVTFSLLNGWLQCRESARLSLAGWTPRQSSFATSFGGAAHWMLQQVYTDIRKKKLTAVPGPKYLTRRINQLEEVWRQDNPMATEKERQDMEFTLAILQAVMPLYFEHWKTDLQMSWTKIETEFKIPIEVERARIYQTFLRGKMDGGFVDRDKTSVLFETKTKSRMDEGNLADILGFELQVGLYLVASAVLDGKMPRRVLYNVIRRPGLRQKAGESLIEFVKRVQDDIRMRPDWYFVRMEMQVDKTEMARFKNELGDLVGDFLDWWYGGVGHYRNSSHCENKYGTCWALSVCSRGNYDALFKRDRVFRELDEV